MIAARRPDLGQAMQRANARMQRKLIVLFLAALTAFPLCLLAPVLLVPVSQFVSKFVPAISVLVAQRPTIGTLPAHYFSVLSLAFPIAIAWLLKGEDSVLRLRYAVRSSGRRPSEFVALVYLVSIPALLATLFIVFDAPISMGEEVGTTGHRALQVMLTNPLGLLILGSGLFVSLLSISTFVILYLCAPISLLIDAFLGRHES